MPKIPTVSTKKFCRLLEHVGCEFKRIDGDHYVYDKPGLARPIVFPLRKDLPTFVVLNNLRTLGISRTEFIRLLKDV